MARVLYVIEDVEHRVQAQADMLSSTTASVSVPVPTQLRIPAIRVSADFEEPLFLQDNGEIAVPEGFDSVAWYAHGPIPGAAGPAIILGHVDSYRGPAVFHQLWRLKVGDRVYLDREDGSTVTFSVVKLQYSQQSNFPTTAVYQDVDTAALRLITCSGEYDADRQRYSHNLIVYAELIDGIKTSQN